MLRLRVCTVWIFHDDDRAIIGAGPTRLRWQSAVRSEDNERVHLPDALFVSSFGRNTSSVKYLPSEIEANGQLVRHQQTPLIFQNT